MEVAECWIMKHKLDHFEKAVKNVKNAKTIMVNSRIIKKPFWSLVG